jgi:hypothetical protein
MIYRSSEERAFGGSQFLAVVATRKQVPMFGIQYRWLRASL